MTRPSRRSGIVLGQHRGERSLDHDGWVSCGVGIEIATEPGGVLSGRPRLPFSLAAGLVALARRAPRAGSLRRRWPASSASASCMTASRRVGRGAGLGRARRLRGRRRPARSAAGAAPLAVVAGGLLDRPLGQRALPASSTSARRSNSATSRPLVLTQITAPGRCCADPRDQGLVRRRALQAGDYVARGARAGAGSSRPASTQAAASWMICRA